MWDEVRQEWHCVKSYMRGMKVPKLPAKGSSESVDWESLWKLRAAGCLIIFRLRRNWKSVTRDHILYEPIYIKYPE